MGTKNRRNIVMGNKTWEKLRVLSKEEERSISDLIREAVLKLFEERLSPTYQTTYDPVTDTYKEKTTLYK